MYTDKSSQPVKVCQSGKANKRESRFCSCELLNGLLSVFEMDAWLKFRPCECLSVRLKWIKPSGPTRLYYARQFLFTVSCRVTKGTLHAVYSCDSSTKINFDEVNLFDSGP